MKNKTPYLLLVTATLFWGGNFVIGKSFSNVMPPFTLSLIRWTIAFLVLLPFAWKEYRSHHYLWKKHWKITSLMALTGIVGFTSLVYVAVHYTTSINATLVNSIAPASITFFSFLFLRDKLAKHHYAGIFLSILGVLWIISRGTLDSFRHFSFNVGELLIIAAVITWTIYSILVKKYNSLFPTFGLFLVTIFIGIVILSPFALYEYHQETFSIKWSVFTVLGLLYLGVCASIISFLSWNKAVGMIGPAKASPFLNLIPVFASFFAILFLDEQLHLFQIIGGGIVIIGVLITTDTLRLSYKKKSSFPNKTSGNSNSYQKK